MLTRTQHMIIIILVSLIMTNIRFVIKPRLKNVVLQKTIVKISYIILLVLARLILPNFSQADKNLFNVTGLVLFVLIIIDLIKIISHRN